ncbi:potassium channel family protein [Deinococcus radiophilus]|uniref:Two pore domain potassium channel family protein n=1 Tax=Deinococcus radiophilus TaxID=32062 RepID=A0A3S0KCL0_9DEIO|nr:potassium channel family protein [Deinococcus radiophilus]RTR27746.1 two pore domain potassium channel family protein [Deinococcus radiophilus]
MSTDTSLFTALEALRPWLGLAGLGLLLFALLDLLTTSLQMGEGPLTRAIYRGTTRLLHALRRRRDRREVLAWNPIWMVMGTFISWFVLTWLGWTLLFWSQADLVTWAEDEQPASLTDTAYFVGYTLTTLGLGDLHAKTSGWRLLTPLAALNGFFLLTFAITFLTPIASSRSERRQVSLRIFRAGPTPQAFVLTGLNDHPHGLAGLLHDLSGDLIRLDAQHRSALFLHSFYDHYAEVDPHLQLAVLGEALLIAQYGLKDGPPKGLQAVRDSVEGLIWSFYEVQDRGQSPLPPLSLEPLRQQGVNVVDAAEFQAALEREQEFRRGLYDMATTAGWPAEKVTGSGD